MLRRVRRHLRQDIGHVARLDLGGDVEQHAALGAVEDRRRTASCSRTW
jgi:hypothetical protein